MQKPILFSRLSPNVSRIIIVTQDVMWSNFPKEITIEILESLKSRPSLKDCYFLCVRLPSLLTLLFSSHALLHVWTNVCHHQTENQVLWLMIERERESMKEWEKVTLFLSQTFSRVNKVTDEEKRLQQRSPKENKKCRQNLKREDEDKVSTKVVSDTPWDRLEIAFDIIIHFSLDFFSICRRHAWHQWTDIKELVHEIPRIAE